MIHDLDRTGYIGASDTKNVMRSWNTKTFKQWWDVKMGIGDSFVDNIYTQAGNVYEGKILDHLEITERDRQIIIGRLRVNLDGETDDCVVECKTYKWENGFKLPKHYWQQVQVEMYATGKRIGLLYAYGLLPEDYTEYGEIDPDRLSVDIIFYDEEFIEEYLKRAMYLCKCIEEGRTPNESEVG